MCIFDISGNRNCIKSFENLENANFALFKHVYQSDYLNDNDELRECYFTNEEAKEIFYEYYAKINKLSLDVSKSILRKKSLLKIIKEERELERIRLKRERIEKESLKYINLIDKNEDETFGQTAKRLAEALGCAIDRNVFFDVIRKIRGEE